jgi:hypothetical protein
MKPDELDRILSAEDEIVPASGLLASVMDLVRREASAPSPIPLPWARLAWGVAAVLCLAAWLTWSGVTEPLWEPMLSMSPDAWASLAMQAADAAVRTGVAWVATGVLVALLSTRLATRLASPRT